MTSFNLNYLLKTLSPNTVTMVVRMSTCELGGGVGYTSQSWQIFHLPQSCFIQQGFQSLLHVVSVLGIRDQDEWLLQNSVCR